MARAGLGPESDSSTHTGEMGPKSSNVGAPTPPGAAAERWLTVSRRQ
jgi:hypothetical protein